MKINLDTHISIPDTVYTQEIGEETILLDTHGGRYFGLDTVGTRMWQLLRQYRNLRPAYETLLAEYDVNPEQLEIDFLTLVQKMVDHGLAYIRPG